MDRNRSWKWFGELVVIVVGVLVALAVDDWVQYRSDRELEGHLLERMAEDLVADAGDLASAQVHLARREWLFDALAEALEDGGRPSQPPDSLVTMERHVALLEAAGRSSEAAEASAWADPLGRPLWALHGTPEFDLSDDSFQEMLATGALRTLRDRELRAAIMTYYRTAQDMGGNVMSTERYQIRLREDLLHLGVSITDPLSIDDVVALARADANLAAQIRDAQSEVENQFLNLDQIEEARHVLEESLARGRQR